MLKPFPLFDVLKRDFGLPTDFALAEKLGVSPPHVSKVRNGELGCSAAMMLRVHEAFGIPVRVIRTLAEEPTAAESA